MSFTNSSGGTLALPSPTHAHHLDVTSAVRKLRRELFRSPSKFLTHAAPHTSQRAQHDAPTSPSRRFTTASEQPRLPATHAQPSSASLSPNTERLLPSALTPYRSSVKLSLRSAKSVKTGSPSFRTPVRARPSPRSPLKRALSTASDSGNAAPPCSPSPSSRSSPGQENTRRNTSPLSSEELPGKPVRHSVHLDVSGAATQYSFLDALDADRKTCKHSLAGALKRSDATMNLDYSNRGSPVAKRRSLHGIAGFGQLGDLLGFGDHGLDPASFDIHDESQPDDSDLTSCPQGDLAPQDDTAPLTHAANMPRRSSSLRKSTLQQRCGDKTSWGRKTGERQLAQMSAEPSSLARRPLLSTENFSPPPPSRDSPFAPSKPTPWAALPSIDAKAHPHQPHPLSKTLTTSTSGNSLTEETESDAGPPPPPLPSFPRPAGAAETKQSYAFSRSLPLNAMRPSARPLFDRPQALTTPNQSHQLWVGAFESTGLISKVNRNFDDDMEQKLAPPDTPCKKHAHPFATFPPPTESVMKRKTGSRNSFAGLPSTPFNRSVRRAPDSFGAPGRGLAIFQRGSLNHARRGSILGREGDDRALFGELGSLSVRRKVDPPPTPTRHLTSSLSNLSEQSLESPSAYRSLTLTLTAPKQAASRKPTGEPSEGEEEEEEAAAPTTASHGETLTGFCSHLPLSQEQDVPLSPTPPLLLLDSSEASSPLPEGRRRGGPPTTDVSSTSTVSEPAKQAPADSDFLAKSRKTPQTPQEGLLSLDANRLSLSQTPDHCGGMPPPVTPTADRGFRSSTHPFVTPVNGRMSDVDIDPSLYSRFDAIEQVGKGQFSSVYRVTKVEHPAASAEVGDAAAAATTTPSRSQVFAVKKSRHSYHGRKDRDIRLREVHVLRALRHAEHVVQFVDSWEANFHLYIQTEFCEEGTLARFLGKIGRSGRLDDFRIFKILQDLCLGVKEIHDAGFMHLDLKPANVFIHFDGSLKIGDFGLAQAWTGSESIDVEGDREYMAPEMLSGHATQAADIFSLGLIALEVAANVILPDNGPTWVALRSGDLTEIPSLTWSPSLDIRRDADGKPSSLGGDLLDEESLGNPSSLFESSKRLELQDPPEFMYRGNHPSSLDSIVRWMTAEVPDHRPLIDQVLAIEGMQWIAEHREAPATVYEGNWGPTVDFPNWNLNYDSDAEMLDV